MDLRSIDDDFFVVRFGTRASEIDVYTVTQALAGIADAMQAINAIVNPDYDLEIILESTGDGSFITRLRTNKTANTVFNEIVKPVVIGVLTSYIWMHLNLEKPSYHVENGELVIDTPSETIRFDKSVFDEEQKVSHNPAIAKGLKKSVEAVDRDQDVESIAIIPKDEHHRPAIELRRDRFPVILNRINRMLSPADTVELALEASDTGNARKIVEHTVVGIIKAVLKRSNRKWEFNWQGTDISAAITDPTFFDRMQNREFAIAQGDSLDVDLTITQIYEPDTPFWKNIHYEVTRVYALIEAPRQRTIEDFF